MTDQQNPKINTALLLPIGLLILEVIAVLVLITTGYEITTSLTIFLIFLGFFLLYQIVRQVIVLVRVRGAVAKMADAKRLADSGKPLEAIKAWKKLLLNLPKEDYLQVLSLVKETYQALEMHRAVQKVKTIQNKSDDFFEMLKNADRYAKEDRRQFQSQAMELRQMIKSLPEERPGGITAETDQD